MVSGSGDNRFFVVRGLMGRECLPLNPATLKSILQWQAEHSPLLGLSLPAFAHILIGRIEDASPPSSGSGMRRHVIPVRYSGSDVGEIIDAVLTSFGAFRHLHKLPCVACVIDVPNNITGKFVFRFANQAVLKMKNSVLLDGVTVTTLSS